MSDNAMTFSVDTTPVNSEGVTQEVQVFTAPSATQLNDKQKAFEAAIPEAYKSKEFVQNALKSQDPFESVLKGWESAQQLIGKVTSPAMPASPDEYTYQIPDSNDEQINAFLKAARADETVKQLKLKAQEAGMTVKQFETFMRDGVDDVFIKQHKEAVKAMKQMEDTTAVEFETLTDKVFGQRKPQVIEQGKSLIEACLPPELRAELQKVDNHALMLLTAFADGVHKRFISPDKGINTTGQSTYTGVNRDPNSPEFKAQLYDLMKHPAYADEFHPQHAAQKGAVHRLIGIQK